MTQMVQPKQTGAPAANCIVSYAAEVALGLHTALVGRRSSARLQGDQWSRGQGVALMTLCRDQA